MSKQAPNGDSTDTKRRFHPQDFFSGLLVFLVALPLCLGIAAASEAPLFSGLLAGIVGGIVIGILSGSHTGVSGPAAGMTAIVASQIAALGSFEALLVAIVLSGVIQLALGALRAGALTNYFPISIVKGLLAAIGVIVILKMAPQLIGHDVSLGISDLKTFSSSILNPTAGLIGVSSLGFLLVWNRIPRLKSSIIPAPMVVVVLGAAITLLLRNFAADSKWVIPTTHLVDVPVAKMSDLKLLLTFPDWSALSSPQVYVAAIVIAVVSSLNTLMSLKSIENIDPEERVAPKNRELFAQGVGNIVCGLVGALPATIVIIRTTVNLNAGCKTRYSAIFHGVLLLVCVLLIPQLLNAIPLSSLAALLIVTGFNLASATLFRQMWKGGMNQFVPFITTLGCIVFIDLLSGLMIGMGVGLAFVLKGAIQTPYSLVADDDAGVTRYRVRLSNQVTFLNQAKLSKTLDKLNYGSRVILDATMTHHLDPCIETLLIEFITKTAPEHDLEVSFEGFEGLPSPDGSVHFGGDAVPPESGSGGSS
ncbi:MAG TPA: hypothetical protein DCE43_19310 [Planctomycetaceae bacterium]|nr:hypothetical protein [Planctomycetaceae bacterium]|tara:strand:+ start:106 stop:1704 length:1599 start_codon:yes stop_codon:yes gene_type:complete